MKTLKRPPYLVEGDMLGIVCPSGYMPFEKAGDCIQILQKSGFVVRTGKTLGNSFHYFSGTDDERLADMQEMLDDPKIKAILCGRGGYGLSRIIDRINWQGFLENPKWVIGFSDITIMHSHINSQLGIQTIHSQMAGAFQGYSEVCDLDVYLADLLKILKGGQIESEVMPHPYNKIGRAKGILIGGNLAILSHLIGSDSAYNTKSKILFLEDVGEYIYNVDRMMWQLRRSGFFDGLTGLIVGNFTEMKDTIIPFGKDIWEVLSYHTDFLQIPVGFGFPIGHTKENIPVKIGQVYVLEVTREKTKLEEMWE